jgi:TonB family protein
MSNTWNQWEGQVVDGKYPLLRCLGGSEQTAVFATELKDNSRPPTGAIRLVRVTREKGEIQLARWQQASELSHRHLIPLFDSGWVELGGGLFVYLVMERAEENLSQVLPSRSLDASEAREMLTAVLDVLSYLHVKGFVHGGIRPANIMASGDQLKVSSDALLRSGESLENTALRDAYGAPENSTDSFPIAQPMSPASDVWSVGMTLVETLTRTLPVVRTMERQDPFVPATLPEPFLDIARHCLLRDPQRRWTIAQISDRLQGRAPVLPAPAVVSQPKAQTPASRPIVRRSGRPAQRNRYAVPLAIGIAAVLAAVVAGPRLLRHSTDTPQAPAVAEAGPSAAPVPSETASSPETHSRKSTKPSLDDAEPAPKAPVPTPAIVHPESVREEATNTVSRSAAGSPASGGVAHRAMPEVLQSARNSIRGTVRVSVKVNVDRAGNVEDVELASRGPSKYFAQAALESAQKWKFNPPKVGGRGVLSTWLLQFEFTRDGTNVVPTQELP